MIAKDAVLSTVGFVLKSEGRLEQRKLSDASPIRINLGFISSAVASMINDRPKIEDVSEDVFNLRVLSKDLKKSYGISDFIIEKSVKSNLNMLKAYFNSLGLKFDGYKTFLKDFKVSSLSKCGALIKNEEIIQARLMGINDSHIVQFDRDFIGYFLYINFSGKIAFFYNKNPLDLNIPFSFGRIPLLSFKSENAFKNDFNKKITVKMLKKLTDETIESLFV